jgi:hypothetical protein
MSKYKYFTREEYTKGRDVDEPLNEEQENNLDQLLQVMDKFREAYGKPLSISSGYRPSGVNASVGGAKKSAHMSCQAVDFFDPDGEVAKFCMNNIDLLIKLDLYLESPAHTKGWVHLQTRKTKNRIFIP